MSVCGDVHVSVGATEARGIGPTVLGSQEIGIQQEAGAGSHMWYFCCLSDGNILNLRSYMSVNILNVGFSWVSSVVYGFLCWKDRVPRRGRGPWMPCETGQQEAWYLGTPTTSMTWALHLERSCRPRRARSNSSRYSSSDFWLSSPEPVTTWGTENITLTSRSMCLRLISILLRVPARTVQVLYPPC